jgi:hypothetical protein
LRINKQLDAASNSRLSPDQPDALEPEHHLVDRRWTDLKKLLHIGFSRRSAVQVRICADKRQILALLGREGYCGTRRLGHRLQPFVCASNLEAK